MTPRLAGLTRLTAILLAGWWLGCAGDGGDAPPSSSERGTPLPPRPAPTLDDTGYEIVEVASGGAIRGTVRFEGSPPPPRSFAVDPDAAACGVSRTAVSLRTGPAGALADAVVSLRDIARGAPPIGGEIPLLDQRGCEFVPHLVVVPVGGGVRVRNSDPLTHNVHTLAFENRSVNRSQPAGSDEIRLDFGVAERVRVRCDIHPWMGAWIVVTPHPYVALTGEDGSFGIEGVPPGSYTLEVWHEALGATTLPVRVESDSTTTVAVALRERGPDR